MSEENKKKKYGIENDEFFITEEGKAELAKDLIDVVGVPYVRDAILHTSASVITEMSDISHGAPFTSEIMADLVSLKVYIDMLFGAFEIPDEIMDEVTGIVFGNIYMSMENIKKVIKEREAKEKILLPNNCTLNIVK